MLYEPRCEAVLIAVDWRDCVEDHVCRRPQEHARLTRKGALPVCRVCLEEITPRMQSRRYQLKPCDRPQDRRCIGSQLLFSVLSPRFEFLSSSMRGTQNFCLILNRVALLAKRHLSH